MLLIQTAQSTQMEREILPTAPKPSRTFHIIQKNSPSFPPPPRLHPHWSLHCSWNTLGTLHAAFVRAVVSAWKVASRVATGLLPLGFYSNTTFSVRLYSTSLPKLESPLYFSFFDFRFLHSNYYSCCHLGGCTVGHDWSYSAAAAAARTYYIVFTSLFFVCLPH